MEQWNKDEITALIQLDEGFTPLDIWQEIHVTSKLWAKKIGDASDRQEQLNTSLRMVKRLTDFPAQRWIGFNHAIGWTKEAITALSWCKRGSLHDIFTVWNKLNFMPSYEPNSDFAALLLNPALLPENKLSIIVETGMQKIPAVCLLLAARTELPEIDLPSELQERLPSAVVKLLQARGLNQ